MHCGMEISCSSYLPQDVAFSLNLPQKERGPSSGVLSLKQLGECGAILKDVDGSLGTSLMAFIVLGYQVPGGMANGHLGQRGYFFPHPNTQIYLFIFTYSSGIARLYEGHLSSEM